MAASDYPLLLLLLLLAVSSAAADNPDLSGLINSLSQGNVASLHDTMQCMQKLLPCKAYLNASVTDAPPENCCSSLKEVVDTDFECLCRFYNDPQILPSMNITRHDALQLPKACNVRLRLSKCQHEASSPTSSATPVATDPAATQAAAAAVLEAAQQSSANGGGKDGGAASSSGSTNRITYLGGVVVVAASVIFNLLHLIGSI